MFRLHVGRSRSRRFLFLLPAASPRARCATRRPTSPTAAWRCRAPRGGSRVRRRPRAATLFYIRTNARGPELPPRAPRPSPIRAPRRWTEVIPHRDDVMLDGRRRLRRQLRRPRARGRPRRACASRDLEGGGAHHIAFPEPAYDVEPGGQRGVRPPRSTGSATSPWSRRRRCSTTTSARGRLRPAQADRGAAAATTRRATGPSASTPPPPTARASRSRSCTARTTPRDGTAPMLLAGYGAYGIPYPAVLLVEPAEPARPRRVASPSPTCAAAATWASAGTTPGACCNKRNTFTDFVAAADFLVAEGYTARDRLVIEGGSAGGLLIGAVLNLRPDLCRAPPSCGCRSWTSSTPCSTSRCR